MAYVRIAVSSKNEDAIIIETDTKQVVLKNTDESLSSASLTKTELEKTLGTKSDLFIHKNRDGSIAVATGNEPESWPEDKPDFEDKKTIEAIK